jgi:hypothetical protein
MKEVFKTPGKYIDYETSKKSITFGDEDLTINLKNREMDETITIDICSDKQGFLVVGAETGFRYVAQIEIPARQYEEETGEPDAEGNVTTTRTAVPFDIDNCTIYLWGMED